MQLTKTLIITVLLYACSYAANGAEIRLMNEVVHDKGTFPTNISIEGNIESGDLEKVWGLIIDSLESKKIPRYLVLLDSNGGNLYEAMKIGSLANHLYLNTLVMGDCYSACAFIALGSQSRRFIGNVGLHRPYYDPKYYSKLSPTQADSEYNELYILAKNYLNKNYVSDYVIDKMFSVSSSDAWVLSPKDADAALGRLQPPLEEWIKSRCGVNDSDGDEWECFFKQLFEAQNKAYPEFFSDIQNELKSSR